MKYLLLLFLPLIFSQISAQETHNFKIENGKLIYEKVIQDSLSTSEALKMIAKNSGHVVLQDDNYFTFRFENIKIDYKKYGHEWGNTATFLNYPHSGNITFETKGNRYKIRAENLTFSSIAGQGLFGGTNGNVDLDPQILKKKNTEISTRKLILNALSIYDRFFTEIFQSSGSDDNW